MGNTERDLLGEGLLFDPGFAGRRDHELLVGVSVLSEEWMNLVVNINTTGSETTTIGNILSTTNISGSAINMSGAVNINTGGTATTTIGNTTGVTTINVKAIIDGTSVNSGTNIFRIKQNTGSYNAVTDFLQDPFSITSPSGSATADLTMGMGVDTTLNCGYINCAMSGFGRPLVLSPRLGNVYVGEVPTGFNANTHIYTNNTYGNLVVKGNIYCNSPIIPKYGYPITAGTGSHPYTETTTISTSDKIGYCYYVPLTQINNVTFNDAQYIRQITSVPRGVYMVSWTIVLQSGASSGFQGFICTGLNFTNNSLLYGYSGFNYYQSGYSQIRGYAITTPTALTGSCTVFIHDGSNHNTIAVIVQVESSGNNQIGSIQSSMCVSRIA
jgi:hypothetical protein